MGNANQTILVTGISNREFLERYAHPGRVGLSTGITLLDKAIARAERHTTGSGNWGLWSHAFLFQGKRHDGHHWVIESDVQVNRKHVRLGVQENRISKYFDENLYTTLAVMDFSLAGDTVATLLREGLELVSRRARYSLRELIGTYIALHDPKLRSKGNPMARDSSMYCSAFVQHLFSKAAIELAPGVHGKNTTPEDISLTVVPHTTYLLQREIPRSRLSGLKSKVKGRMREKIERLKAAGQRLNARKAGA